MPSFKVCDVKIELYNPKTGEHIPMQHIADDAKIVIPRGAFVPGMVLHLRATFTLRTDLHHSNVLRWPYLWKRG